MGCAVGYSVVVVGQVVPIAENTNKKYIEQLSQLPELEEDCGHLLVGKDQQQLEIKPELWAVTSGHLDSLPTLLKLNPMKYLVRQ